MEGCPSLNDHWTRRSGLDLPTLMKIKNQSLAAVAERGSGWERLSELELQVRQTGDNGYNV